MSESVTTYWIDADGHKQYMRYDRGRQEATVTGGKPVVISHERLMDFLHTWELLGNRYGEL